jgi:hypothetical protein
MDVKTTPPPPSFAERFVAAGVALRGSQHEALAFVNSTSVAEVERIGGGPTSKTFALTRDDSWS